MERGRRRWRWRGALCGRVHSVTCALPSVLSALSRSRTRTLNSHVTLRVAFFRSTPGAGEHVAFLLFKRTSSWPRGCPHGGAEGCVGRVAARRRREARCSIPRFPRAQGAAPPAAGGGAELYVGRVAAAEARSAMWCPFLRCPRGARRRRRSAVARLWRRALCWPRSGGGGAKRSVQFRGARAKRGAAGGRRRRRALCCMAAVARSAVFNSAVPARSAARPAAGGGAEGCVGPRSGGGGAKRCVQFRGARAERGVAGGRRWRRALYGWRRWREARGLFLDSRAERDAAGGRRWRRALCWRRWREARCLFLRCPRGARRRRRSAVAPRTVLAA